MRVLFHYAVGSEAAVAAAAAANSATAGGENSCRKSRIEALTLLSVCVCVCLCVWPCVHTREECTHTDTHSHT